MASEMLVIDGSYGEGGGQVLRTALSLAAVTGRPFRIERFRAGRPKPGIAAQHLTAIRAAAAIVGAELEGDTLGSDILEFHPRSPPVAGAYHFDIAEAREGGSAGAATLVLQTLSIPLALARGETTVTVNGGTHVPWSPSFDYFDRVWLAMLRRLGVEARAELGAWGFYPAGGGGITLRLRGATDDGSQGFRALALIDPGALTAIEGCAVSAKLPTHIAQRMANRAEALLQPLGAPIAIETKFVHAISPGAWIFLKCTHENSEAGFGAFGRRGKPAEEVAEDAVAELLRHHRSGGAVDRHLADQMLLPLSLAADASEFTCPEVTRHLQTNAWVIEQFGTARFDIGRGPAGLGNVKVVPNR